MARPAARSKGTTPVWLSARRRTSPRLRAQWGHESPASVPPSSAPIPATNPCHRIATTPPRQKGAKTRRECGCSAKTLRRQLGRKYDHKKVGNIYHKIVTFLRDRVPSVRTIAVDGVQNTERRPTRPWQRTQPTWLRSHVSISCPSPGPVLPSRRWPQPAYQNAPNTTTTGSGFAPVIRQPQSNWLLGAGAIEHGLPRRRNYCPGLARRR